MADWTQPTSMAAGDVFTAARWNTDVAANIPFFDWKVSTKTVASTTTETDLLNGEIIIPAAQMGSNERCWGWADIDVKNNTGGAIAAPRFKLKAGSTVLIDTGAGPNLAASATRGVGELYWMIQQLGATNAQSVVLWGWIADGTDVNATTGSGVYRLSSNANSGRQIYVRNTTAIDMTSSQTLALTTINGSSSANCETKLYTAKIAIGV
jgi:hypothetical protein